MKTQTNKRQKIVWAIDPFEKPDSLRKNAAQVLMFLNKTLGLDVEPVYVLRPSLDYSLELAAPLFRELGETAQTTLDKLGKTYRLTLLPPHIIITFNASLSRAVDELTSYAKDSGASLILTNTHARSGMKRLFLGSFAETLLLRSQIPVITINPGVRKIQHFDHILFPTDFARTSYRAFKRVVELAQNFSAKVTLFHMIPFPTQPYSRGNIFYMGQYRTLMRGFVREQRAHAARHSEVWTRWATRSGVSVQTVIESREGGVSAYLLKAARKHRVSLIAMEAKRGPAASTLLGSTTRQVVRGALCPVWIIRSEYAQRARTLVGKPSRRAAA